MFCNAKILRALDKQVTKQADMYTRLLVMFGPEHMTTKERHSKLMELCALARSYVVTEQHLRDISAHIKDTVKHM